MRLKWKLIKLLLLFQLAFSVSQIYLVNKRKIQYNQVFSESLRLSLLSKEACFKPHLFRAASSANLRSNSKLSFKIHHLYPTTYSDNNNRLLTCSDQTQCLKQLNLEQDSTSQARCSINRLGELAPSEEPLRTKGPYSTLKTCLAPLQRIKRKTTMMVSLTWEVRLRTSLAKRKNELINFLT